MHLRLITTGLVLALALPSLAAAGDYWVDAVNGDDANGGTGPGDAWLTITHALNQLGTQPGAEVDLVHVLPGDYKKGNGEQFPLELRDRVRLIGEGGPEVTHLLGGIRVGVGDEPTGPETGAQGFTIRGVTRGVELQNKAPLFPRRQATFSDLIIRNCDSAVFVWAKGQDASGSSLVLEDTLILECWRSVHARAFKQTRFSLTLRGVVIRVQGRVDLRAENGGILDFLFERSSLRITEFLNYGMISRASDLGGHINHTLWDSEVISFCLGSTAMLLDGAVLIERSTISGHDDGLALRLGSPPPTLRETIIWGNGQDLSLPAGLAATVENCIIDHDDFTGINGNIDQDPLFRMPSEGDFSLRFGSPAIDRLPASRGLDRDGHPRSVDGDLDTDLGRDLGAFELHLLSGPQQADLGSEVTLEVQGPTDAQVWVMLSREAPMTAPMATAFGGLWLRPETYVLATTAVLSSPLGTPVVLSLPADPVLAGATLGLQALIRSPAARAAHAWSNVISLNLQ